MDQDETENQPTSIKLSYNKFVKISNSIVTKLRSISSETDEPKGMSANDLVDWYLETIEEELESEEAYIRERRLVKLVIKRMITKVNETGNKIILIIIIIIIIIIINN